MQMNGIMTKLPILLEGETLAIWLELTQGEQKNCFEENN